MSTTADKKTVLVVVTDIFFYTKVRDALLPQGYHLERARVQQDVPQKAASLHPVAMILNLSDPAVDGMKALEAVKADRSLQSIPVLAFANHEEVDTWKRAKELGVTKIVSRNEFSAYMRKLVEELLGEQPAASSE